MKRLIASITLLLAITVLGVWGFLVGCTNPFTQYASPCAGKLLLKHRPHGGTNSVNDAAYDAMFFKNYGVNPYIDTDDDNLSTFAIDVDTGSYTLARSYLNDGNLPSNDAVRVEEFVNYFKYNYKPPTDGSAFAVHLAAAPSVFDKDRTLLRVALKGREIEAADRKDAVLTFVIDTSGSMGMGNRLELVKKSLKMLLGQMRPTDKIGIVEYGSTGRVVLSHRTLEDERSIIKAIDNLEAEGSTYAEDGLRKGYELAEKAFVKGAINRVILCSDGVANVGNTGPDSILKVIKEKVQKGITLSAVGFGMGNYNDVLLEQLGDKGNGHYAYVDSLAEAKRVFVENLTGTLQVVARDVKVQVEFNKDTVRSYRLVGYENRDVADEDFRNDKVDGGEIGAGHATTAIYELKMWSGKQGDVAKVRVRYKDPEGGESREVEQALSAGAISQSFDAAPDSMKLAATVAQFAEILRKSYWAKGDSLDDVLRLAKASKNDFDHHKDIAELVKLIEKARDLKAGEKAAEIAIRQVSPWASNR